MADVLRVEPALLHLTSADIESVGCRYAAEALRHRDTLSAALGRWPAPASRAALERALSRWETQHAQHLRRAAGLGQHVCESALSYAADSADSADAMVAVLGAAVDAVSDAAPDL